METKSNTAKVCQVCGDGSAVFQQFIVTCSRCSSTHEHVYCMRVLKLEFPKNWICESCSKSPWQQRKPGKVKFIGQDEVIRLSSGAVSNCVRKASKYTSGIEDPRIKRFVTLYGAYLPSQDGAWKGGISIVESELVLGFQAQLPSQVRRQAYQISQKLPPILQVKMRPRPNYLEGYLGFDNIALYFFPSSSDLVERGRFDKVFKRMESEEWVMIGHVDEVELIISTSKQLKADVEVNNFMWGVFRQERGG